MSQDGGPFNNCGLFSNHYLEKQVKESSEWHEPDGLAKAHSAIKENYLRKSRVLENYNESQLEENFIRPILRILGHSFGVQGTVQGKGKRPDYAFFSDEDSLNEVEASPGEDYYQRAVAIGDAKAWKVSLDKQRGRGSPEMQNPSFQIDAYLRDTPAKWAILTNGRLWRLYHESTSYKLDSFYEVNLPALLADDDLEAFKYFYLFFRREAFPKVVDGESFLDSVRERSIAFAQEISEDLQKNVYRAMKILAEGFIVEARNGLDGSKVGLVQENALRLLYRLLFIFYAESRRLLDADNKYYYELSLQKLKSEVSEKLDRHEPLLSVSYSYWEKLKNLFNLINDGSESRKIPKEGFYIPAYNGGLFDPEKNEFLEEMRIGDVYLAEAIDLLARSHESEGRGGNDSREKGFVDYSSLEIRHLGSIYEGLLEYRLMVAGQEMAAVKEKGKELWLPSAEVGSRKVLDRVSAGEIYLTTDRGERKATGSYYTPDYIVKYIVKNTLEPIIRQKLDEWGGVGRLPDYILSIKVLDPAMGSGHFLVEATDQLARFLVQAWGTARPEETDTKEVAERDVHWARREVVRNCIYGVDLNPMAVELAKLSLWLTTVASNKPLSFLDHHLRCGNTLIGAKLSELMILPNSGRDPEQLPMWQFVLKQQKEHTEDLLKRYAEMATKPDDDLQTVKWKKEKFEELKRSEISRRINELANVWLSTYFGNMVEETDYEELQNHLSPNRFPDWSEFRKQEWFRQAQELASEKRFFHWELEFPEAFAGVEKPGFDVVIGNPPYVRQENLSPDKPYFECKFETYQSSADLYVYFIELGLSLLDKDGQFSYISANKWMRANYGEPLRKWIKARRIEEIIDFGDLPVFSEATTYPCILRLSANHPRTNFQATEVENLDFKSLDEYIKKNRFTVSQLDLEDSGWSLVNDSERKLLEKLQRSGIPLGEYTNGKIYRGVLTGLNEAFVIDSSTRNRLISEDPKSAELIKPFLVGKDIKRYEPPGSDQFLILIPNEWTRNRYPGSKTVWIDFKDDYSAIANYLLPFAKQAEKRYDKGEFWWELRACDYYEEFEKPKIFWPEIAGNARFTFDSSKFYANNKTYIIPDCDFYMLSLLNSSLLQVFIHSVSTDLQGNSFNFSAVFVERTPIRRISFSTPEPERARLVAELKALYQVGKVDEILSRVEAYLPKDSQGNFISGQEKSDVVHDLLAFLAEQMLEMNKQKQKEIKGFLGWLEGYVGAKADDLTPKTKIQSYYDYDFDELLAVLKKNKKKLKIDPSRREPAEALRDEFQASVNKLTPLRDKIERTDKLIDQVVCKLYGLTEEEIGIVEGKSAS